MSGLDQFFTRQDVAARCWKKFLPVLQKLTGCREGDMCFVEPGAGHGAFYDLFPSAAKRIGIDIAPCRREFAGRDFLAWRGPRGFSRKHIAVVGNPPFGGRGDMAVKFFNKAATMADTIAFIVPVIFRKYFIHKTLAEDFRWVGSVPLPRDAFWTDAHERYSVNAEFQIWTRLPSRHRDRRLFSPPPIAHRDFVMHQYNNTHQMLKVFAENFDFAVPCQGWQDYSRRERDPDRCEKHKQWMLFKAVDKSTRRRLHCEIDFGALAQKNTTMIPGFRKGDVVQEYSNYYG